MSTGRSIEDRLREEYFDLLPDIERVARELKAKTQYFTLQIAGTLHQHEQLVVQSRVKECSSAIDSIRRRQEGREFDPQKDYSLTSLKDLAGVRVLAFPRSRLKEIDTIIRLELPNWYPDHLLDNETGNLLAYKYSGLCTGSSTSVRAEYQIVSMLTGLFWDVEHAAIYKPSPHLKGIKRSLNMQAQTSNVYAALRAFEDEFEREITNDNSM